MSIASRLRRKRGWNWEDTLVKRIDSCYSYEAYRLGGASAILPDILAISNRFGKIIVIEAKSGTTDYLMVPREQVERSLRFLDSFRLYPNRHFVLAFKFLRKRRLKQGGYEKRDLREYHKEFNIKLQKGERAPDIICTYGGNFYMINKGLKRSVELPDFRMPFL
ncbi:MAG: resolvase [Nitrososphaerales archaeon]